MEPTLMHRSTQLQAALRRHNAPVAVFVNCFAGDPRFARVVRQWALSGASVGNHTAGHRDLHRTEPSAWAKAVRICDAELTRVLGRPVQLFRFPALHQGTTAVQRDTGSAVLKQLRYRNAPVTIDNSDYIIAAPYRAAVEPGDTMTVRALSRLMLRHNIDAVRHFRSVSASVLGRQLPHIMLLHANEMTADNLDQLMDSLAVQGARFISIDEALADPAYGMKDRYMGRKGLSWLYRIQAPKAESRKPWQWDDSSHARLEEELARLSTMSVPSKKSPRL